jgi:hypothetical protein
VNIDFRVSVDFFTHHKARKLQKRLGPVALLSLLKLWAYAAKMRPNGNLPGGETTDRARQKDHGVNTAATDLTGPPASAEVGVFASCRSLV